MTTTNNNVDVAEKKNEETLVEIFEWTLPKYGLRAAIGLMTVPTILRHKRVDKRTANSDGYQREPTQKRLTDVKKAVLGKEINLPTCVLMNLREYSESDMETKDGRKYLRLIHTPDKVTELWAVDGQTRMGGLELAYEDNPDMFSEYQIPFVIGLGWTKNQEMEEFFVVNYNAKSVPTNLAWELLREINKNNPDNPIASVDDSQRDWQVVGTGLMSQLNEDSTSVWFNKIRLANAVLADTTIQGSGFTASLKPVLRSTLFSGISTGRQLDILNAYWHGIYKVFDAQLEEQHKASIAEQIQLGNHEPSYQAPAAPKFSEVVPEYLVQKRIGVSVFHGVLPDVIERIRSQFGLAGLTDPENYKKQLAGPLSVAPEDPDDRSETNKRLMDFNGDIDKQELVSGLNFWQSGHSGAAANFSSGGGVRILTARLKRCLDDIDF